jgi:hypothetical protein
MRRRYLLTLLGATLIGAGGFLGLSCVLSQGGLKPYEVRLGETPKRTFVLFGDSRRTLTAEFWRKQYDAERLLVVRALADEDPAFILNTGDLVSHGADADEWKRFAADNEPIFSRKIPYFAGLGNHEYYGDNDRALAHYFALFPHLEGRKWYDIRKPPVLILVLDSNFDELERWEVDAQNQWLSKTLDAAERDPAIRHVILACHHAPYTNSLIHADSRTVQEHFVSRKTPKVKAFVTGHVHSYERFVKGGVQYVVSGGGGAPLTAVEVEAPEHPDEFKGPAYRRFHYLRFTLDGDRLACDVLMLQDDRSWKRVDGFECP